MIYLLILMNIFITIISNIISHVKQDALHYSITYTCFYYVT